MDNKDKAIMKLFKAYVKEIDNKESKFDVNENALKKGILISDNCSLDIIKIACELWGKDGFLLNQTFHKSFLTVVKSRQETLICQQIMHYITTYGFEEINIYDEQLVYIPNERLDIPKLNSDIKLINIRPITEIQLKEKLLKLSQSAIPLSEETIKQILELSDYMEISTDDLEKIKNKELKVALYEKLNILPENPNEFFRYLIYVLTKKTLVIKDRLTIQTLKTSDKNKALKIIKLYNEKYNIVNLAEIFNRYKPLFLALKTTSSDACALELNSVINKISHLSKKYHKPMKKMI